MILNLAGPRDPWLMRFLELIRQRPAMYLGDNTVHSLKVFLHGYAAAREDLGLPGYVGSEADLMDGFTYWLALKYQSRLSVRWAEFIELLEDDSDHNIRTFYMLFDAYRDAVETTSVDELREQFEGMQAP